MGRKRKTQVDPPQDNVEGAIENVQERLAQLPSRKKVMQIKVFRGSG